MDRYAVGDYFRFLVMEGAFAAQAIAERVMGEIWQQLVAKLGNYKKDKIVWCRVNSWAGTLTWLGTRLLSGGIIVQLYLYPGNIVCFYLVLRNIYQRPPVLASPIGVIAPIDQLHFKRAAGAE